jgi:uncharacterized protein (TIGR02145 family)
MAAANIQANSAVLIAEVNPNYLSTTIVFEWGISTTYGNTMAYIQNPLTGSAPVFLSAALTGLTPGATYHFRVKGENTIGISLGSDMTFKTLGGAPIVTTEAVTNLQTVSATINGTMNPNYYNTTVSFEWGATMDYGNIATIAGSPYNGATTINVSAGLSGLAAGKTYHYRITATSISGTTNGSDMTFSTDIADIDNNSYRTIAIGNQLWTAENLRTSKYNDGTSIPLVEDGNQWISATAVAYCFYNNLPEYKNLYGALYNWYTVDQSQNGHKNICPAGWHVPKKSEWIILFNYLSQNGYGFGGNSLAIAKSLASTSGWDTGYSEGVVGYDQLANNASGFNGQPAGLRLYDGTFSVLGRWGGWWAQPDDYMMGYSLWYNVITQDNSKVTELGLGLSYATAIRCLKD